MDEIDKSVKRFPLEMSIEMQTRLRDASYYSGQSKKEIISNGANEEIDRLLATYKTLSQVLDTERQGLTPPPLKPLKKKILKRKVVN